MPDIPQVTRLKAVILMTALPPTKGHAFLIDWALDYCAAEGLNRKLYVLVSRADGEPYQGWLKVNALRDHFSDVGNDDRLHITYVNQGSFRDAPTGPEDHEFWQYWVGSIYVEAGVIEHEDIVFASETYGITLAEKLGCRFVPCDLARKMVNARGTRVRDDPMANFAMILPESQRHFRQTITLFGAESTGKSTMARSLAMCMNGHYVDEWARPYLESLPTPEVTLERMQTIMYGQQAAERTVAELKDKPFIFRDTDLLSTAGYYRHMYPDALDAYAACYGRWSRSEADLYVIMNSTIPFEADPLRYGGDKRETSDEYWIDLCKKVGAMYYVVQSTERVDQYKEIEDVVTAQFMRNQLWSYKRI